MAPEPFIVHRPHERSAASNAFRFADLQARLLRQQAEQAERNETVADSSDQLAASETTAANEMTAANETMFRVDSKQLNHHLCARLSRKAEAPVHATVTHDVQCQVATFFRPHSALLQICVLTVPRLCLQS